jgi:hypothetical protein
MSAAAALATALAQLEAARAAHDMDAVVRVFATHRVVMLRSGQAMRAFGHMVSMWTLGRRGATPSLLPGAARALLDATVATLLTHERPDEAVNACFLLFLVSASATCSESAWAYAVLDAGLAEALVAAMRRHGDAIKMQLGACMALAEAALHRNPAARDRALAAGLLQAVVGALQQHCLAHGAEGSEDVRKLEATGVRVLSSLLLDAKPATLQLAHAAGALRVVLAALRAHMADAYTLQLACACLGSLAQPDDAAGAADIYDGASLAMHAQPGASFVQVNVCAIFVKLLVAGHVPARCPAIAAAVVTAMHAHASRADVQIVGCGALGHLADAAYADAALDADACVTAVAAAMRTHSTQPELLSNAICALSILMHHPSGCTRAVELDVSQLAVRAAGLVRPADQEQTARRLLAVLAQAAGVAGASVRAPVPAAAPAANDAGGADACARPGCSATGGGVRLMRCAGCRTVQYCGIMCQKAHWREHKTECGALRDAWVARNAA